MSRDLGLRPVRDTELVGDLRVWVKLDVPGADVAYIPGKMAERKGQRVEPDAYGMYVVCVDKPYIEPLEKAQTLWSRIKDWALVSLEDIFVRREEE